MLKGMYKQTKVIVGNYNRVYSFALKLGYLQKYNSEASRFFLKTVAQKAEREVKHPFIKSILLLLA